MNTKFLDCWQFRRCELITVCHADHTASSSTTFSSSTAELLSFPYILSVQNCTFIWGRN
ncbi:hypothetical protein QUC31_009841 [Theobroma cacao]